MGKTLKDAIYGLAVGDALGVPFEFRTRGLYEATGMQNGGLHNQPIGTWSDDTSMTLATCHSIKEKNAIDIEDIRNKFLDWYQKGMYSPDQKVFDIGLTIQEALKTGIVRTDEYANGNGSLMRILPLAFTKATDEEIRQVSAITHGHDISKNACVEYIHIARKLIEGQTLEEALKDATIVSVELKNKKEEEIFSSGYVIHTFEAAIWCLLNTNNYKDAILKAVNLGEDTDTVAAVAGGLAGIIYGIDEIPKEWVQKLREKEIIDKCI